VREERESSPQPFPSHPGGPTPPPSLLSGPSPTETNPPAHLGPYRFAPCLSSSSSSVRQRIRASGRRCPARERPRAALLPLLTRARPSSNPSGPLQSSPRAATSSSLSFFSLCAPPWPPLRRAAAPGLPSSNQLVQDLRRDLLYVRVRGIDAGRLQQVDIVAVSLFDPPAFVVNPGATAATQASSTPPAASW
jgi:hypothetical protein